MSAATAPAAECAFKPSLAAQVVCALVTVSYASYPDLVEGIIASPTTGTT